MRGSSAAISDTMLRNANAVRLYLRCTFLSDIASSDLLTIPDWAMNGGPPLQGSESYPAQPAPTDRMLSHWRQLLRSSFLLSSNLIDHPPSHPLPLLPTQPPASFTAYLIANEHELSIMGEGVLHQDDTASYLADRISSGLPINAFGDGTVKDGIGAHGWHIRPSLDLANDNHSIESAAQTDGHEDSISSV